MVGVPEVPGVGVGKEGRARLTPWRANQTCQVSQRLTIYVTSPAAPRQFSPDRAWHRRIPPVRPFHMQARNGPASTLRRCIVWQHRKIPQHPPRVCSRAPNAMPSILPFTTGQRPAPGVWTVRRHEIAGRCTRPPCLRVGARPGATSPPWAAGELRDELQVGFLTGSVSRLRQYPRAVPCRAAGPGPRRPLPDPSPPNARGDCAPACGPG